MVRHKNRYIVLTINQPNQEDLTLLRINQSNFAHQILEKIEQLHGNFGVAAVRQGFQAKYCNELTKIAVIRARHGPHMFVTSSLPFLTKLEARNISINILYVGATIKQAFKFIKNYQQTKFDQFCVGLKSDEERQELKDVILNYDAQLKTF